MTTLVQAMLSAAKEVCPVFSSAATGGTTSTLVDTALLFQPEEYIGGTLFVTSGTNNGLCKRIVSLNEGTITFTPAVSAAIIATDAYSIVPPTFKRESLKNAVLRALVSNKYLQIDTSLTTTASTEIYALPSGVSDIRRVEIASSATQPYNYVKHFWWQEVGGNLYLDANLPSAGMKIRLWYVAPHAEIAESGTINAAIDLEFLKWTSVVNLWREHVQIVERDNPIATDMLNEAKQNEATARVKAQGFHRKAMPRDPYLAHE